MGSEGQWLKVAGGEKAELLTCVASQGPLGRGFAALECGAFIGYSAARFAVAAREAAASDSLGAPGVVSVECDPVHAVVARHFLDRVCCACTAEILPGMLRDVLPAVGEMLGMDSVGIVFMDQKGTAFHGDFASQERLHGRVASSHEQFVVLADNVLRPGAPVFSWNSAQRSGSTFYSLPEFLEEEVGVEDWMTVVRF